jgi:hypothetical protein
MVLTRPLVEKKSARGYFFLDRVRKKAETPGMEKNENDNGRMALAIVEPGPLHRLATDVAGLVREVVTTATLAIEGRNYVKVEGWQAIANGFGCVASARDVQRVFDESSGDFIGFKAIGEVRRMSDQALMAVSEGFIGTDEVRWFGGKGRVWNKQTRRYEEKHYDPAPEYAARSMVQTRAISRACKAAFAFVILMIDKNLSTTPAEEMEPGDEPHGREREVVTGQTATSGSGNAPGTGGWQDVICSYGTKGGSLRGRRLGDLTKLNLVFLFKKFVEEMSEEKAAKLSAPDKAMVVGLKNWSLEQAHENPES